MAANQNSKILMCGITGNEKKVIKIKNITMIGKKGVSGQREDINLALISDTKAEISEVSDFTMVGVDYTESNVHSTSAANSGQLPTNVETEQLDKDCDMK
jgi:hypothetical protein